MRTLEKRAHSLHLYFLPGVEPPPTHARQSYWARAPRLAPAGVTYSPGTLCFILCEKKSAVLNLV